MSRNVKSEIDRRTTDASKLAALEARKVAILEMVAGLMQEAVDLMRSEGFGKVVMPYAGVPTHPAGDITTPPVTGATIIKAAELVQAPAPQIKNPCAVCGQEATGYENMADGSKKYLCRAHYQARAAEKQEEATTKALMGSEGTLYVRPKSPQQTQPAKKIIIQADPLLGQNGPPVPPTNNVLADADD